MSTPQSVSFAPTFKIMVLQLVMSNFEIQSPIVSVLAPENDLTVVFGLG